MRISDWSSDVCSSDLFVMGETIDAAVKRADRQKGELASFDMLGEAARTAGDAQRYYDSYAAAIARIGRDATPGVPFANHGISIKMSALHPRYAYLQGARVAGELRSEEHTSALQSLMRISYAVFCL